MQAFLCTGCNLAFDIGHYHHWDLTGDTDQVLCTQCGTMHRIEFHARTGDLEDRNIGTATIYSLPGPILDLKIVKKPWLDNPDDLVDTYEWPITEDDWKLVATMENRPSLASLVCSHCNKNDCLISLEYPTTSDGVWPIFRDTNGDEFCPLCDAKLRFLYDTTVN